MFPIPWNFPFRKKDGSLGKIEDLSGSYTLPTASADTKGGIKIGTGLTVTGEVLSADAQVPTHSVSEAGKVLTVGEDGTLEWDEKGAGGGDAFLVRDLTKEPGRTLDHVTYTQDGATFDNSGSAFVKLLVQDSTSFRNFTMYLDIPELVVDDDASNHQRFLMGTGSAGLIFESTNHSWGFYGSSWEYTGNTNPELFNNCTLKLYVDADGKWHVYKDGVLLFESVQAITTWTVQIGSNSTSIKSGLFTGARFYDGNYTE